VVVRVYERNVAGGSVAHRACAAVRRFSKIKQKMNSVTYQSPFDELELIQIKRIMDLCQEIHEDYRRKNPDGFSNIDDWMNAEPCSAQLELDLLYEGLSKRARQEMIALKEFGKRGFVKAHHWKTDLRAAMLQLDNPDILNGYGVGLQLLQGLKNMSRTGLLPGMPVWNP
jgi:hypothetical protein